MICVTDSHVALQAEYVLCCYRQVCSVTHSCVLHTFHIFLTDRCVVEQMCCVYEICCVTDSTV